jgi:hypothetical protein
MRFTSALVAVAIAVPTLAVPSLNVPACPKKGTVKYTNTVPSTDKTPFPPTEVDLCYSASALSLTFTAYDETNFFYNASLGTNDAIYNYEVMEAFLYRGTNDPTTYYLSMGVERDLRPSAPRPPYLPPSLSFLYQNFAVHK